MDPAGASWLEASLASQSGRVASLLGSTASCGVQTSHRLQLSRLLLAASVCGTRRSVCSSSETKQRYPWKDLVRSDARA